MSETLSSEDVRTALEAMPGWEAGRSGLERTVAAEEQDRATLVDALQAVAAELSRDVGITTSDSGLHVSLGSSDGAVRREDVEVAIRVDRLLAGGVAWDKY